MLFSFEGLPYITASAFVLFSFYVYEKFYKKIQFDNKIWPTGANVIKKRLCHWMSLSVSSLQMFTTYTNVCEFGQEPNLEGRL
jgi:hypothetical protein